MERTLAAGDYLADHLADAPVLLLFIADPAKMAITVTRPRPDLLADGFDGDGWL